MISLSLTTLKTGFDYTGGAGGAGGYGGYDTADVGGGFGGFGGGMDDGNMGGKFDCSSFSLLFKIKCIYLILTHFVYFFFISLY